MPICALCLNERPLARSHIYPRFTFRRMLEGEGRFFRLSTNRPGHEGVPLQDDCVERLLCAECEARLSPWENYIARRIREGVFDGLRPNGNRRHVVVQLDYEPSRLFLLSLLWRTHAARRDAFHDVNLGDRHSRRLRAMLLSADAGEPWEYGCVVAVPFMPFDEGPEHRPPVSVLPETVRFDGESGLRIVRMQIDGVLFQFMVGNPDRMRSWRGAPLFLQRDGHCIVGVEDITNIAYLRDAWARMLGFDHR